jgi:O-antigen ligase
MINRLTTAFIYLILFLLPWQTRWIIHEGVINKGSWEYGTISLYALDILIIITLIGLIISRPATKLFFKQPLHRLSLIIFGLYSLCLIPFSISPWLSLYRLATFAIGIILFVLVSKLPIRKSCLAFISGATVSSLLGVWQFLSQTSITSKWLGLAGHQSEALGVSVIEALAPDGIIERWLRAYGSFDHPNMFGGVMALSLIIASWLWLFRKDAKNKFEGIILIISLIVLSAGTIVSFSRAAWLAAGVGIITTLLYYLFSQKKRWPDLFAWCASIGVVTLLITSQYSYLLTPRITGDTRLEEISITERLDGLKSSKELFFKKPLFGFGVGTYTLALQEINDHKPSWYYQPVHNSLLVLLVEIGLLGIVLLGLTLILFGYYLYKNTAKNNRWLITTLFLSIAVLSFLDHWLVSLHFGTLFIAALLGLIFSVKNGATLTE